MNGSGPRNQVKKFPTPRLQDIVFWESKDSLRKFPFFTGSDNYGDAHPNAARFPNHRLSYIEDVDEKGIEQRWWYCADRESQESWNYDVEYVYGGNPRYPRITRTYVLRRGTTEAANALDLGTADPGGSSLVGGYVLTSTGGILYTSTGGRVIRPSVGTAVLVAQSEHQLEEPIGSLYVAVKRIFDVIPGSEDTTNGDGLGQADNGYTVSFPNGDSSFARLEWKLTLPREVADNYIQTNYKECPIAGYTNLKLVSQRIESSEKENQTSALVRVYEGNISAASASFPSTAYVQYQGKFYPGALPPQKFIVSWREVEDTYETDSPQNQSVATPSTAPNSPANIYQGGLIGVEVKPREHSPSLRGGKGTKYYTDLVLQTITGREWSDELENYINYTIRVLPRAEADAVVAAAGTEVTVQPVNAVWSIVTTESPTVGMSGLSFTSGASVTYQSKPFYWPPVLTWLAWGTLPVRSEPGADPDDSNELYFQYVIKPGGTWYSKATTTIAFSTTNPLAGMANVPIEQMIPSGLRLDWPGVANVTIPPCLHFPTYGGVPTSFSGTTGTNHPEYGYIVYSYDWEPTNYTDWPSSLVTEYDVKKWKGGYLVRKVEMSKPTE